MKNNGAITVTFEDDGQDFLEWDLRDGIVFAVRPYQHRIWAGTIVLNQRIEPGDKLIIKIPAMDRPCALAHRVASVRATVTGEGGA